MRREVGPNSNAVCSFPTTPLRGFIVEQEGQTKMTIAARVTQSYTGCQFRRWCLLILSNSIARSYMPRTEVAWTIIAHCTLHMMIGPRLSCFQPRRIRVGLQRYKLISLLLLQYLGEKVCFFVVESPRWGVCARVLRWSRQPAAEAIRSISRCQPISRRVFSFSSQKIM